MAVHDRRPLDALPFHNLTDYDLIAENQHARDQMVERLVNNGFKAFLETHGPNTTNEGIDPLTQCKYYDTDTFTTSFKSFHSKLSVYHMNIRRLGKHRGELYALLNSLDFNFQIIILTEIGHDAHHYINDNLLPEYHAFYVLPTNNNKYGGTAILVRKDLGTPHERSDLKFDKNCDCHKCETDDIWVEINTGKSKYIVGGIYRHPNGNQDHFTKELDNTLSKINPHTSCIIAGDINIDLLHIDKERTLEYFTTLSSYNLMPCISLPTRLTDSSATLIDHIFVRLSGSDLRSQVHAGNLYADISDHLPNFVIINDDISNIYNNRPFIRIYSERNINKFKDNLHNTNWDELLQSENIEDSLGDFYCHMTEIFNSSFPLVKQSRKRSKDKKWITAGIINSIRKKNLLYKKQLKHPTPANKSNYRNYKNILSTCMKEAENSYYSKLFSNTNNSATTFWKTFGSTLNPGRNKSKSYLEKLIINGQEVTNNTDIANELNNYFCKIGGKISNSLPTINGHFSQYLKNKIANTFYMSPLIHAEVLKELKKTEAQQITRT